MTSELTPACCSYYHPAPPQKVVIKSERTFDGISLDKPGLDANRTGESSRLPEHLCDCQPACIGSWDVGTSARALRVHNLQAPTASSCCTPHPAVSYTRFALLGKC